MAIIQKPGIGHFSDTNAFLNPVAPEQQITDEYTQQLAYNFARDYPGNIWAMIASDNVGNLRTKPGTQQTYQPLFIHAAIGAPGVPLLVLAANPRRSSVRLQNMYNGVPDFGTIMVFYGQSNPAFTNLIPLGYELYEDGWAGDIYAAQGLNSQAAFVEVIESY